jgi:hypothetical protein
MGKNNTLFYNEELQKLQIEADEIFAIRKSELKMYCLFEDINSTWPILTKPLIETKIDTRVRFSKTLPIFFKAILKAVQDKT